MRTRPVFVVLMLALAGCGPISHTPDSGAPSDPDAGPVAPPADIPEPGSTASQMIGGEGGTIEIADFAIDIPAGAVAADTMITVTVTSEPAPETFTGFSPVFRFEPAGLEFETPVTVRLPFAGNADIATVFWTSAGGGPYVPMPTSVEGNVAIVEATHFSSSFVGTACAGEDCCDRGNGDLDVLLMIDNSNSMAEEQASLAEQIPRLARVLATGDSNLDGIQDFPALRSLRIGTVSSDMGVGGHNVPTCDGGQFGAALGDDGVLRTAGNTENPSCAASYPSYAELASSAPAAVDQFVDHVACVATIGTGGCGFEQQLDAVLKAVTPSTSSLQFADGTSGHADGANAGFLRADSIVATILLTDETDCSASDADLFDASGGPYAGTDLNLRCFAHPEALYPTSRYDALRAIRSNPDDVIFGLIAGVPADLVSDPSNIDYDALLADPRMQEVIDSELPNRLTPSCDVPGRGVAFPPVRLVNVARGFGSNAVVQSICQEDFTPVVDAILERVARRVTGACGS